MLYGEHKWGCVKFYTSATKMSKRPPLAILLLVSISNQLQSLSLS